MEHQIDPSLEIDEEDNDLIDEDDGDGESEADDEGVRVYNYIVSTRTERETIEGRDAAVKQAKEMTADGSSVQVERADGRVRMQFRDGSLVEYVYETRKGRTV